MNNFLKNRKILLIVTGGIACYRSLDLIRKLQELGSTVECILTKSSLEFVNQITFESLLGKKVHSNLFSLSEEKKMFQVRTSFSHMHDYFMVSFHKNPQQSRQLEGSLYRVLCHQKDIVSSL